MTFHHIDTLISLQQSGRNEDEKQRLLNTEDFILLSFYLRAE